MRILKELIKQKRAKLSLDDFIDKIIKDFAKKSIEQIRESFEELIVFAYENFSLDKEALLNLIFTKIENLGIKEYNFDKESLILSFKDENLKLNGKISFGFDNIDVKAIKLIDNSFFWLRNEYNTNLQERVKNSVKMVMDGKLARKELADHLKNELEDILKGSQSYFEGVADNIINQNRNLIAILERNPNVEYFKVEARMDNRTSEICRSMHGRLIKVEHLEKQVEKILNSKNMADKKNAAIWRNDAYYGRSDDLPSNFGLPPYHFRCRTFLIPVYPKIYEIEGEKMRATSDLDENEIIKHIDKTGVERILRRHNTHLLQKHGDVKIKDIIKGLNSIIQISPKDGQEKRSVAISQNGLYFVFEGDKIVTAYYPGDKKTKNNQKKHFQKNAIKNKIEVIKWSIGNSRLMFIKTQTGR